MTPEEVAKKHCYNGHNPESCSLLADLRQIVAEAREEAVLALRAKMIDRMAAWRTQYEQPMEGPMDLNSMSRAVVDSAIKMVRETS